MVATSLCEKPKLPSYAEFFVAMEKGVNGKLSKCNQEPRFSVISKPVAKQVCDLYKNLMIPHVTFTRVLQMIETLHAKYTKIKLYSLNAKKKNSPALENKITDFKTKSKRLFDIAKCKCIAFLDCKCAENDKVPENKHDFLLEQRSTRKRYFLEIEDNSLTQAPAASTSNDFEPSPPNSQPFFMESQVSNSSKNSEIIYSSGEFDIPTDRLDQTRVKFNKTVMVAERFGVSLRATAAITSAALADAAESGLMSDNDFLIVDKNKIFRDTQRVNNSMEREFRNNLLPTIAVYFDGRKDSTLAQIKVGNKLRKSHVKEEHITVLSEPRKKNYLGHFVPLSGSAEDISNGIYDMLLLKGGVDDLEAAACDGTVVNTGWKNGVIRCLEKKIERPLQWIICLLHFNELPLRALFVALDGVTDRPKSFSGPLGKQLEDCEKKTVIIFQAIECILPDVNKKDLSVDQKYLLNISKAINSGKCTFDLSLDQPGTLNHA